MSPPSPALHTNGCVDVGTNGPAGVAATAAPRHILPAATLGPVKYMRYWPSARLDTSGAQNPLVPAQTGFWGNASPRMVHGPVGPGAVAYGVRPRRELVEYA